MQCGRRSRGVRRCNPRTGVNGVPVGSHDTSHAAAVLEHARHGDAFCDADAPLPRALHERHRHVDGVDAPVALHVEAAVDVGRVAEREEAPDVCGADLLDVDATEAVERSHAAELLHAVCVCGDLDEAHGLEARRDACLCFEPGIQVALQSEWQMPVPLQVTRPCCVNPASCAPNTCADPSMFCSSSRRLP